MPVPKFQGNRLRPSQQPTVQAPAKHQGVRMHQTVIAGEHWALNNLDATTGLEVLTAVLGILGRPLGALAPSLAGSKAGLLDLELPADALSMALAALMQGLADPGSNTVDIVKTLLATLHKGALPAAVNFDEEFASRYKALSRVLLWALQINFGDFFEDGPGAAGLVSRIKTAMEKASTKEASIGESGE